MINQPTWGVDAGAALAIHEAIMALAEAGTAVMIISQDLDEIFVLADRIAVIAGGHVSAPVLTREATVELIGRLMGGGSARRHRGRWRLLRTIFHRHGRACPGHPPPPVRAQMAGTRPAMTQLVTAVIRS